MRLSQLARQLEISPSELIIFFEKNTIDRYTSHNNKIKEEDVDLAFRYYKSKVVQNEKEAAPIDGNKIISAQDVEDSNFQPAELDDEVKPEKINEESEDQKDNNDHVELIRMPKIKLKGVKVVGKIDLPDTSIKTTDKQDPEQKPTSEITELSKPAKKKHFERRYGKSKYKGKPRPTKVKRELSYEEKLKRDKKKKIIEQQKLKKLRKEKKKQHYIRNVQSNVQSSKKRRKAITIVEVDIKPKVAEPVHKNPLKRIWAWLNGKYDEY